MTCIRPPSNTWPTATSKRLVSSILPGYNRYVLCITIEPFGSWAWKKTATISAKKSAVSSGQRTGSHLRNRNGKDTRVGFELIPHPTYSPDLAPCDLFLFANLKTWLGGKRFSPNEELIDAVNAYFADLEEF